MKQYVIIGNGVAAVGCIEGIRSIDKESKITVISEENHPVYCRSLISYYLEKKTDTERMNYRSADFYEKSGCDVLYGKKAVGIDTSSKTVILNDGKKLPYTSLCIATGSSPFVPAFEGLDNVKNKFSVEGKRKVKWKKTSYLSIQNSDGNLSFAKRILHLQIRMAEF